MDYTATEYTDHENRRFEAVQVTWADVRAMLGREPRGDAAEHAVIVAALIAAGAPEWVAEAEGWTDEIGYGLIGFEIADEKVSS